MISMASRRLATLTIFIVLIVLFVYRHLKLAKFLLDQKPNDDNIILDKIGILTIDRINKKSLQPVCIVPDLEPFNKDVAHLFKYDTGYCDVKTFGSIVDGVYVLKGDKFSDVRLQYIRRLKKGVEINEDHYVSYSDAYKVEKNAESVYTFSLEEDHIRVSMKLKYSSQEHVEFHSHVARQNQTRFKDAKKLSGKKR